MDYVKPDQVLTQMIESGVRKAELSIMQLLARGFLGGAILAFATTLAFTVTAQTKLGVVGALLFPVGFVMIVLLGLELVTGSFCLIPLSVMAGKTSTGKMLNNFFWVIVGHIVGSVFYALLFYAAATNFGTITDQPVVQTIIKAAESKTIAYESMGASGWATAFIKAILCNWMVTLGAVMALFSTSTIGKIAAMWLPILTFFAQGFEHAVVNMFVIPAGILYGANVSVADWWLWNQIPVLLGNFVGGLLFTGLFLYFVHAKKSERPARHQPAEDGFAELAVND